MAAPVIGVPFEYNACLEQAKERSGTLITTTTNLTNWVQLTNSGIPPSMKIYERRGGTT